MSTKLIATYTLDLVLDGEPCQNTIAEIDEALDNLQLSLQLQGTARRLLAERGGPLAGVKVLNRHDA